MRLHIVPYFVIDAQSDAIMLHFEYIYACVAEIVTENSKFGHAFLHGENICRDFWCIHDCYGKSSFL